MPPVDVDLTKPEAASAHDAALAGLDRLELPLARPRPLALRAWSATWPKVAAVGLFILFWQSVVWLEWKPEYVLPGPGTVWDQLREDLGTSELWEAVRNTMRRALLGFLVALAIGGGLGILVSRIRLLRVAVGSLITGLQTMPSIAWFPLALLLFGLDDSAIYFVVVIGAAPSIANGIISGIDNVPPQLLRVGRSIGAGTVALYRDVIVPAAMPSVIAGLKQGWAFSWRSLMAGELLVIIPGQQSVGLRLSFARELSNTEEVIAMMIVILAIGIVVDSVFSAAERRVLRRRGLLVDTPERKTAKLLNRRELISAPF
jgi:NitT/TauT family transport system permease protein